MLEYLLPKKKCFYCQKKVNRKDIYTLQVNSADGPFKVGCCPICALVFDELVEVCNEKPVVEKPPKEVDPYKLFAFITSVSQTKNDLISDAEFPEVAEKRYDPWNMNKAMSLYPDTILHANEMNQQAHLSKSAQYRYYLAALRPRKRWAEWTKTEKVEDLDLIQKYYQCNRTVAKQYLSVLSSENLAMINSQMNVGG